MPARPWACDLGRWQPESRYALEEGGGPVRGSGAGAGGEHEGHLVLVPGGGRARYPIHALALQHEEAGAHVVVDGVLGDSVVEGLPPGEHGVLALREPNEFGVHLPMFPGGYDSSALLSFR